MFKKFLFLFILIAVLCPVSALADTGEKYTLSDTKHSINSYIVNDEVYVRIEDMAYIFRDTALNFDVRTSDDGAKAIVTGTNYSDNYITFSGKNTYEDLTSQNITAAYGSHTLNFDGYNINNSSFVRLADIGKVIGFGYSLKKSTGELIITRQSDELFALTSANTENLLDINYFNVLSNYYYSQFLSENIKAFTRTAEIATELMPDNFNIKTLNTGVLKEFVPASMTYFLEKPRFNLDPDKPMVAITFDDGPKGENTERILNALDAVDGRATFFMVGTNVDKYPEVVKKISDQGSETANHSYGHPQLTTLTLAEAMEQIRRVSQSIYNITGKYPKSGRPPYGSINSEIIQASGLNWYNWSIDTLDWKTKNADSVYAAVINNVEDGDVILMHDIHSTTVDAAERIIPKLHEMGYQLVTISELAEAKGKENVPGYIKPE